MTKIFKLFFSDLKSIIKNPVAVVLIIGLCLIPSLYAWVNIKACWDPYANTGNMPVAIVNNDQGAVFDDKQINLGNKIIESLKNNSDVGWRFVDEWQGNYGLNEGKYYAMIVIPSDFSKDLTTMVTATPIKPNIIYKVNEKANAVATELTNVAENQLTNKIKSDFVDIVNKSVFTVLNKAGKNLESNKATIMQVKDSLGLANNNLTQIQEHINKANNSALGLQNYLSNVQTNLPKITNEINNMQHIVNSSKSLMVSTKETLNSIYNTINSDMIALQNEEQKIQSLINEIKNLNNSNKESTHLDKTIDKLVSNIDNASKITESLLKILKHLNSNFYNAKINELIGNIEKLQSSMVNEKQQLEKLKSISSNSKENINLAINNISLLSSEISSEINNISSTYYGEGINLLNNITSALSTSMNNSDSLLESIKVIVPQLNALTSYGISSSKFATTQSNNLNNRLSEFKNKIDELNEKTKNVNEENIDKIIGFMKKNPEQVASFLASPIKIKEVQLYDATIFGMGLVPFYSVLSMWVGVLLMSAFLKINCDDFQLRDGEKITLLQNHFGKMMTFLLLSLIQCFIVVLGDVYILGAKPENMKLLMFFTFYTSLIFTIIVFTLASLFGNLGKALAIVMMVFQIAGAGGIYPIQTNPKLFQVLQPFWPFTYAIDGFREAIAGPTWTDVYKDIKILFIFGLIFFILGIFKKPCYKLTEHIDGSFKASGL